jgi:pyruvate carboxylase
LGFPLDGFPEAVSRKVLKQGEGESPSAPYRPGDNMPDVDLAAARLEAEAECGMPLDEQQLASYLMYPKDMRDYCAHVLENGDTSVLPTPVFFYGPQLQQELALEIDPGKTLLVALQSIAADGDAAHKVQFELNGQSRTVRVAAANAAAEEGARPLAEPGNPWHVAAPMPGAIVNVAVVVGQRVNAGSTLLSLEAMKMETHVAADRDAEVEAVYVVSGDRVQAKDLLVVLRAIGGGAQGSSA